MNLGIQDENKLIEDCQKESRDFSKGLIRFVLIKSLSEIQNSKSHSRHSNYQPQSDERKATGFFFTTLEVGSACISYALHKMIVEAGR